MQSIRDHLLSRNLNPFIHRVWVDEDERVATFPLWNLSGQLTGYQQYRPDGTKESFNNPREGRYYTYRSKIVDDWEHLKPHGTPNKRMMKTSSVSVWGLESWSFSPTLFMTEGVFDAARLTSLGYSAIATASNDLDKSHMAWLRSVRSHRRVVAVCDGDSAGMKLARHGSNYHLMPDGEDLGSVDQDCVLKLVDYWCGPR